MSYAKDDTPQVPEAVSQVPTPVPHSSHRATRSFLSSTGSHRHLPLAPSCSSGQGPIRHSDPITQTQSLHSLAGTLGHTPNDKQPGPGLQTRTGAAGCRHDRQCLPAPSCQAEALHRTQRARLVSCRKEMGGEGHRLQGLQLFCSLSPPSITPGWAVSALTLIAPIHHSINQSFIHSFLFLYLSIYLVVPCPVSVSWALACTKS